MIDRFEIRMEIDLITVLGIGFFYVLFFLLVFLGRLKYFLKFYYRSRGVGGIRLLGFWLV